MWKLEQEEDYFRIYDSKKQVAGYFDPDYGGVQRDEDQAEIIESMLKDRSPVPGGFLMLPMVKFGVYDRERMEIDYLESKIGSVLLRISKWREFVREYRGEFHSIHVSHTDQDMLSITLPVRFPEPTPLDGARLVDRIRPVLDELHALGLL